MRMSLMNWSVMKMISKNVIVFGMLMLSSSLAWSAVSDSNKVNQSQIVQSGSQTTEISDFELDQYEQKFWGLSDQDWALYQKVKPIAMQLSKTVTPSTPPEVLGIFARTMEERKRYAKLFSKKYVQYVDSSIVSMRLVRSELRKLNAGRTMFDYGRLNALRGDMIGVNDRIQFFTKVSCDECHVRLAQLINQVRYYKVKLDVFVVDDSTDIELQQYAEAYIPEELVKKGYITLNRDKTFLGKHKLSVPVSFISRDGQALEMHTMD